MKLYFITAESLVHATTHQDFVSARVSVVVLHTGTYMTYIQLAKTIVVVACLLLACDWTPCVPLVIQVLHVFPIVTQVHFIIITVIVYIC